MTELPIIEPASSDAELIARARAGSDDAFAELYERHVGAAQAAARALAKSRSEAEDLVAEGFTRLLSALRSGAGPEVAFRPYLLACVRNAFYDRHRKDSRVDWSDNVEDVVPAGSLALLDPNMDPEERHLIARAFTSLPERWQLVLWHTEVEGRQPADVAPLLGLAPNAVAALAYRAREGLRKAYLQAHLQLEAPDACRYTRERLGAYVRDGVNTRERELIERHLDHCDDCRAILLELQGVDSTLRRALIPLIIGVGPAAYLKFVGGGGVVKWVSRSGRAQMAVAAGAVAAVVSGALIVANATDGDRQLASVAPTGVSTTLPVPTTVAGTLAPPVGGRPTSTTGVTPTGTVPSVIVTPPPTVPGRGTSTTIRPTVTTARLPTTTTRRPTTTTRKPATTTTRPASTTTDATIDPDEGGDREPTTTVAGGGGGGESPIPTPQPPAEVTTTTSSSTTTTTVPANFAFTGDPSFAPGATPYAGDTVTVQFPVTNNGGAGAPPVTLTVSGGQPRSAMVGGGPGSAPALPVGRAAAAPVACTLAPGSEGPSYDYTCPPVPAGQEAVLTFDIVLGARGTPYNLVVSANGKQSRPLTGTPTDPLKVDVVKDAGTLTVTLTNQAVQGVVSNANPVTVTSPALVAVSTLDRPSRDECGALGSVVGDKFSCANLPSIPPGGSTTLKFGVQLDESSFSPTVTVGIAAPDAPDDYPPPLTTDLHLTDTGPFRVDVLSPGSTIERPEGSIVKHAAMVWRGESQIRVGKAPVGGERCDQTIEGVEFHGCVVTGVLNDHGVDPYDTEVVGTTDWRLVVVLYVPTLPETSVEIFTRLENTAGDGDSYILDGEFTGIPSLGLVGFGGGVGGSVVLSSDTGACTFVEPYKEEFTARPPVAADPPCPDLGDQPRFDFYGPPQVVPKLFIVQRPVDDGPRD